MRLLKLFVPIFLSIILIVLDARFSYLDNIKRFTLTLLSPIYLVVDLLNSSVAFNKLVPATSAAIANAR